MRSVFRASAKQSIWPHAAVLLACLLVVSFIASSLVSAEESQATPQLVDVSSTVQESPVVPAPPVEPQSPVIPEPSVQPEPPIAPDPPVVPEVPAAPELPLEPEAPAVPEPAIETPAQEEPQQELTVDPVLALTPEPTIEPTLEPTPEPTVEPTPEPTPVVTWSQPEPVTCSLRDGSTPGLKFNESHIYRCTSYVIANSDLAMPDDMKITWQLDISFPDSHLLQFSSGSQAAVQGQLPISATATTYTVSQPWQPGSTQRLEFDIVVTRTACAVGEQVLTVQASPDISTDSEAEIKRQDGGQSATQAAASFLPNTEVPSVTMTPVNFGTLEWDGQSWGTAYGSSTVTVTNDAPCPTSQPHLVQVNVAASSPGMEPKVSSVDLANGLHLTDSGIASIPAGFDGSASVEVGFTLTPSNDVHVGEHLFEFEVNVTAAP